MTPEAQRIAIAEACGWTRTVQSAWDKEHSLRHYFRSPDGKRRVLPPDFLNDLNAMHEAENNLAVNLAPEYGRQLALACERNYSAGNRLGMGYNLWHATAAQRAEAFLKTLGLWKEGE